MIVAATLALLLFANGCVAIGNGEGRRGGGTMGQQLIDLQKARDCGAINPAEYEAAKAKILQKK